jgi:SAM-dependent methyltransferase
VDVGCGTGIWAAEFSRHGVTDILGIDGSYVDESILQIPVGSFLPWNCEDPIRLERTFDLAMSLEVAEHLSPGRASSFVYDLTCLAPVVLFSAAIPGQGGTNHINEQWPSYWCRLFQDNGFQAVDCLRTTFWNDARVGWCYRQNMLLYVREDRTREFAHLMQPVPLDLVHPRLYAEIVARRPSLGILLQSLPGALTRSFKSRVLGVQRASMDREILPKL